jgi:hypothetical protein
MPKNNNPSHRAFACVIAGTTGTREPNWQHFYNGNASDGSALWSDIGAGPTFVYQVTSEAGGLSGSSAPIFPAGLLYVVIDNGLTWTNIGVAETATWASSAGGVSVDGTKFTSGYSTNNYSSPGGQNSGLFATAYDSTANVYHLFNTGTGIATDFVCRGGSSYNCAGGVFLPSTVGTTSLGPDSDLYYIHNVKASEDGKFVVIAGENCINNANCAYVYHIWQPTKGIVKGINPPCAGHWTRGYKKFACEGKAGLKSGTYFTLRSLSDPNNGGSSPPNPVWAETPCGGNGEPTCTAAFDGHWNWAKNDGTDTTPIFGSTYNVKQFPYSSAYQNEVVGFTTVAPFKQWRFTHTFATATNDNFNAQYVVGQAFQQGDFYAWTSDWGATLGTNDGSTPIFPAPPYPSTANCLGGFPWLPKTTYYLGTMIHPVSGYTTFGVYQLVAILGGGQSSNSGSSTPSWLFGTPRNMGSQVTDGSQIWQNLGQGNCRGDLFVVSLR